MRFLSPSQAYGRARIHNRNDATQRCQTTQPGQLSTVATRLISLVSVSACLTSLQIHSFVTPQPVSYELGPIR